MGSYERRVERLAADIRLREDAERYLREQDAAADREKHEAWRAELRLERQQRERDEEAKRAADKAAWKARGPIKYVPGIISCLLIAAFVAWAVWSFADQAANPNTTPLQCPAHFRDSFCEWLAGDHREFYR